MENFAPNEVIQKFKADPAMKDIVAKLSKNGVYSTEDVSGEDDKAAYDLVVEAQKKFEEAIVEGLKSGKISAAVAVIHTGGPANPLSHKVTPRTPVLEEFMEAGGILVCVYQKKNELGQPKPPEGVDSESYKYASERFATYQERYGDRLQDCPVEDPHNRLTQGMSGASYIVMADHERFFYSFKSFQLQTIGKQQDARKWGVWSSEMGDLYSGQFFMINPNKAAQKRHRQVSGFLDDCDIHIDSAMEMDGIRKELEEKGEITRGDFKISVKGKSWVPGS